MISLKLVEEILSACKQAILYLPGLQAAARKELIQDLQNICSKCDDAYSSVLTNLSPINQAGTDAKALASALSAFASDASTRSAFKPEHLCGEVDHLRARLKSYIDPLPYSLEVRNLDSLGDLFRQLGSLDSELYHQYDQLTRELNEIARQLTSAGEDTSAWVYYAKVRVDAFAEELSDAVSRVRKIKDEILAKAF